MLLLVLAFVAGMLTALAPCVLPLLPVIIGGALGGEKKDKARPYVIVGSLAVSLLLFTLLLKTSTLLIGVSPKVWIYLSGGIVILLGLTSLFPGIWETLIGRLGWQAASQRFLGKGVTRKGIFGSVLTGAALGPVFSSCSPTYAFILATVLPRNFASGLIYLMVYCLGLVAVLLVIAVFGQRFISKFEWAVDPRSIFRRSLGILFIIVGLAIITGWDKRVETFVTAHGPFDVTILDQKLIATGTTKKPSGSSSKLTQVDTSDPTLFNVQPTRAPELVGLQSWINSDPLTLASLKGKVVLIDFWTYSCINCVRTLPHVEKWYETYKDKGFVVIGIQAPEFAFEKVEKNVRDAVKQHGLTYPIALDNDLATWQAFNNQYWPAHYLIDKNGIIRADHFGEGGYDTTERAIQKLLGESGPLTAGADQTSSSRDISPETYFGTARASNYVGSPRLSDGKANYNAKSSLGANQWTLGGSWTVDSDKVTSNQEDAVHSFHVRAKDVYVVASVPDGMSKQSTVSADNTNGTWYGADDPGGVITFNGSKLYHIVLFTKNQDATIHIKVPAGVSLHTFTFGG